MRGSHPLQYDKWYFFSDSPARRKAYENYIREIARGINAFLASHDYFPVVIGMERLDEKACRDLRAQLHTGSAMFLSGDCPADVMTGIVRSLSLLVTSRYHAAVLSMKKGCPIMAVSMDERLDTLMEDLSAAPAYLFHVQDSFLGERICDALSQGCLQKDNIHQNIMVHLSQYMDTLDDMGIFMKRFFTGQPV